MLSQGHLQPPRSLLSPIRVFSKYSKALLHFNNNAEGHDNAKSHSSNCSITCSQIASRQPSALVLGLSRDQRAISRYRARVAPCKESEGDGQKRRHDESGCSVVPYVFWWYILIVPPECVVLSGTHSVLHTLSISAFEPSVHGLGTLIPRWWLRCTCAERPHLAHWCWTAPDSDVVYRYSPAVDV